MKRKSLDKDVSYYTHAAQIYAEMLGMVCHKGMYDGNPQDPEGYQEVGSFFITFPDLRLS